MIFTSTLLSQIDGQKIFRLFFGILATTLFIGLAETSALAAYFTQGAGVRAVTRNSTGIYTIGNFTKNSRNRATTYGLFHKGELLEVHSRKSIRRRGRLVRGWITKKSGKSNKIVSSRTFDSLIKIGGLNKNVESLKKSERDYFYRIAGLSSQTGGSGGSSSPPMMVEPNRFTCPKNYELRIINGQRKCVLKSEGEKKLFKWAYSILKLINPISPAYARVRKLVYLSFSLGDLFSNVAFEYNPQARMMRFQGFGVSATWEIDDE